MDNFWDYFQIGVLITFTVLVLGRAIYERLHGINAFTLLSNNRRQRALGIAAITLINLWVTILVLYARHPEVVFLPEPLSYTLVSSQIAKIAGLVLIVSGLVLYFNAWKALGNAWRIGNDEKSNAPLVTKGAYGISRNPIYLFYSIYFIGTFLINGVTVFLILTVCLIVVLYYLILEEERDLARRYGRVYEDYKARIGRYFTFGKLFPNSAGKEYSQKNPDSTICTDDINCEQNRHGHDDRP